MSISRQWTLLLVASCALALAACATDPGSGSPILDTDTSRPAPDVGPDAGADTGPSSDSGPGADTRPGDEPIEGRPSLVFVSDRSVRLTLGSTADLTVRYVDSVGDPIADARVEFVIDGDIGPRGPQVMGANRTTTAADGTATVRIRGGEIEFDFDVVASVMSAPEVNSLTFEISVRTKEAADYVFIPRYDDGPLRLQKVDVYLFNSPGNCDAIVRDPDEIVGAIDRVTVFPLADGSFDGYAYEASPADIPITYAVAVAFMDDAAVGFACNSGPFKDPSGADIDPLDVSLGESVVVDLYITELFPAIRGEYEVENQFDLVEFLPPPVQDVVRYIGNFFDSPGRVVFDILEDTGVLSSAGFPAFLREALIDAIDGLLFTFLPESVRNVFETGADVYGALQNVRFQGRIIIFEDADEFGTLGACNEIVLDRLVINFETITDGVFDLRARGYEAAYGTFSGFITVTTDRGIAYQLNIDPYSLDINYGQIAVFILEQIVFPLLLGPSIDSMEAFVRSFIDCESIADSIGWGPLETICDTVIDAAVDGLRDFLSAQSADTGSFYMLQTPSEGSSRPTGVELLEEGMSWGPCALTLNSGPGTFEVDSMGRPGRDRCVWDARLRSGPEDAVGRPVSAAFHAFRRSGRVTGVCGDGF